MNIDSEIKIPSYWIKKCAKFADDAIDSSKNLYKYRGTASTEKMKNDIFIGKMI